MSLRSLKFDNCTCARVSQGRRFYCIHLRNPEFELPRMSNGSCSEQYTCYVLALNFYKFQVTHVLVSVKLSME